MKAFRKAKLRPAARGVYERLSQRLEEFGERERRANRGNWTDTENEQLTEARLALFGSAPQ